MTYRIKDWDILYENNRTRGMKNMQWVPVPNSHDGDGYTQLISEKNGTALFGAWVLIVQVASKCHPRGTLLRGNGQDHAADSLARMTRGDEKIFKEALKILKNIGWIEEFGVKTPIRQEGAGSPHPTDEEGKEGREEKEGKRREQFDIARKLFPGTKRGVDPEYDNFKKKYADYKSIIPLLEPAIKKEIEHKKQCRESGAFCPEWKNFQTWINQGCWTQEFGEIQKQTGGKNAKSFADQTGDMYKRLYREATARLEGGHNPPGNGGLLDPPEP